MLKELLRRPRATIPELVSQDPEHRVIALAGFFFVAFAEGYERIVTQFANLPGILLVAIVALGCLILGMWAWAWIFGGALYLAARLLKGKPGAFASVSAVGYGFFWPGLLAFLSAVVVIFGGYRGSDMSGVSLVGVLFQLSAGLWAVYAAIAAIKAHHEFNWWKAIATYLLPFFVLILGVIAYVTLVGLP
jgi:hypothetical protein